MARTSTGRQLGRWARFHPRSAATVGCLLVAFILIGALAPNKQPKKTAQTASPTTRAAASVSSNQTSRELATTLLARVAVKGRAPKTGYDRNQFGPAWTDDNNDPGGHNGCDTRNDVLRRDLTDVTLKPGSNGCTVLQGVLHYPYTGHLINFRRGPHSADVQIDHVVSLSDAWQTGAQRWAESTRIDLANDPLNLLAVDGPTNEAKRDGDAATWLPPNKAYRCAYVARQIAVKARYRLWMTSAEHGATARVLSACPEQTAPAESGSAVIQISPKPAKPTKLTS